MAKPTKAEEKQVTDWFMTKFWPAYPGKFCGRGKGSRGISCDLMVKINPDIEEQERILGNLKAQVRAHEQKPPERRKFWKIGETYVRNKLWNDEIESVMEAKAKQELKTCSAEGCSEDVHGPNFSVCGFHINPKNEELRQAYLRTGLDRKSKSFADDCRKYLGERMYLMISKNAEFK